MQACQGCRIVVIGAGFAGIEVARGLGAAGIAVTLIDRQNHHLFQPLLYQVATAALSPADIAEPIRKMLRDHPSVEIVLGEVTAIDGAARAVTLASGVRFAYDAWSSRRARRIPISGMTTGPPSRLASRPSRTRGGSARACCSPSSRPR